MTISASSIGPSSTLRPAETHSLVKISFASQMAMPALQAFIDHPIVLDFCYCSLEGTCWTLHSTPGKNGPSDPQVVRSCPNAYEIQSNPMMTGPAVKHT